MQSVQNSAISAQMTNQTRRLMKSFCQGKGQSVEGVKSKRRKVQVWAGPTRYENHQFLTSVIEEEAGSRVTNDDPEPERQHLSGNDSIYNSTLVVVDDSISADSSEHNTMAEPATRRRR